MGEYVASGNYYSLSSDYPLILPPTQGSANQVMKNDGVGNLSWGDSGSGTGFVGFSTQLSFTTSITTAVALFGTHIYDTNNGLDDANNYYVIPIEGYWSFNASVAHLCSAGSTYSRILINNLTTGETSFDNDYSSTTLTNGVQIQRSMYCSVGDQIQVSFLYSGTPTATNIIYSYFQGTLMAGVSAPLNGSVGGPVSSTLTSIPRWADTTGTLLDDSGVVISKPESGSIFIDTTPGGSLTGINNFCFGATAGDSITTGSYNTLIGTLAGTVITTGDSNIAVGHNCQTSLGCNDKSNTVTIGYGSSTTVSNAITLGTSVQNAVTNSVSLGGIGVTKLYLGTNPAMSLESTLNTFVATPTPAGLTSGAVANTFVGQGSANALTTGDRNSVLGYGSLINASTSGYNCILGSSCLTVLTTSSGGNIAVGYNCGSTLTTGARNVLIGYQTNTTSNAQINSIALGNGALITQDNQCMIGNVDLEEIVPNSGASCNLGSATNPFSTIIANTVSSSALVESPAYATKYDATNPSSGTANLNGISGVTVSTNKVTNNVASISRIFITRTSTSGGYGSLYVVNKIDGTSFDILSTDVSDNGTVDWFIVNEYLS